MRRLVLSLISSIVVVAFTSAVPSLAEQRLALVVGNDDYETLPDLKKAVNDARAVSAALSELGFTVMIGENLPRRAMNRKLADLEAAIAPGDLVFFFFAGHGVAIDSANYLIPVDMPLPNEGEETVVADEAVAADSIIRRIQARGASVSFIILDACRDNPFAATGTRSIGSSRGLTRIEAAKGVFVLYSAGIGQTALDRLSESDTDPNSVFTRKFVPLLRTPGLSHVDIAKEVQREVDKLAASVLHPQQPAYYDQIIGKVVLRATDVEAPSAPAQSGATAGLPEESGTAGATERAFTSFESNTDRPGGDYASLKLSEPDALACQKLCAEDQRCLSWTYVAPGYQGTSAVCWLKNAVPTGVRRDVCCTSGVAYFRSPK
ncbi:MAG: caspase family protein [Hyphomicrobiaceae bacterium]